MVHRDEPPALGAAGAAGSDPPLDSATPLAPPSLNPDERGALDPTFLGRYRRSATLGAGGMGEVHLCTDQLIRRDVAMKVARRDQSQQLQRRFLGEARIQGQLEHPSILPVYDLGCDPDGQLYFTMKRVHGSTLAEVLQRKGTDERIKPGRDEPAPVASTMLTAPELSRRRLLGAFSSVCLAVDFAHSRGVLHRDLKPGNVILGRFGEVYVLDWGLATVIAPERRHAGDEEPGSDIKSASDARASLDDAPVVSATASFEPDEGGAILGTVGYAAPEQLRGGVTDERADVYSLGVILFEILAGAPLHQRTSRADARASTLAGADARTSMRCPEREVPPELEAICVRATRTDPDDRFPTARALHEAIERYLDGDRDLQRRRELADEYARSAEEQADRALAAGDAQQRSNALREASRALALDPESKPAVRTLLRLLTEPARELPDGAREARDRSARQHQRSTTRVGGYFILSWIAYAPLAVWMGVRSRVLAALLITTWIVTVATSFLVAARPHPRGAVPIPMMVVNFLVVAASTLMFGPFLLAPSLALIIAGTFALARDRSRSRFVAIPGCLGLLVPLALEQLGWLPPSYRFDGGVMMVVPRLLSFPPVLTTWFLMINSLASIIGVTILVTYVRDQLARVEDQLQFHAWQLRQLIPDEPAK